MILNDILSEITAPRSIENIETLQQISDILRFVLTLFVHEQDCEYRLLGVILDISQMLYYVNNRRKRYLLFYFMDHGIWADTNKWRECIISNIKYKIAQSDLRMKWREDRQRKLVEDTKEEENKKSGRLSAFKMGFGKLKGKVGVMMQSKE